MIFFPPNTTSKVQPLDQGIIRAFKVYYRSRLVKHVISSCTLTSSLDQVVITALDAIYWIEAAWKNVTESTIRNTFRTAGFKHHHISDAVEDAEEATGEVIDNEPFKKLDTLLSHLEINGLQLSATQYVMVDDEIPVFNEWEDDPETFPVTEDTEQDQEENQNQDEVITEEPPSLVDALQMIRKLHLLVSIRQPELHQLVSELESKLTDTYIDSKSSKQSSITDFFSRV
jgi:DDE superfamily endonuclease